MLCQFSFRNFKSYKEETVFDFQAAAIPEFAASTVLSAEIDTSLILSSTCEIEEDIWVTAFVIFSTESSCTLNSSATSLITSDTSLALSAVDIAVAVNSSENAATWLADE